MARTKGYILVEGHGEIEAMHNLVTRLSGEAGAATPWSRPLRWKNLHQWEAKHSGGVLRGAELVRARPDAGGLLVVRDEDDGCPRTLAPKVAARLRGLALPFPAAYVLLKPEYEVLFLPCLARMNDLGFPPGLRWDRDRWEARRGIKEWLSSQLPPGRSYKPTVLQLAMTRRIDLSVVRDARVPCSWQPAPRSAAPHRAVG